MAICDSDEEDQAALDAILKKFPGLAAVDHQLTSRPTRDYNCIAFALGEDDCRWWPVSINDSMLDLNYWPRRLPREETVEAFRMAFESKGYKLCANAALEDGIEKIALYCDQRGTPTHAARQIASGPHSGQWQSKIGMEADIRHQLLACLEGADYGAVHSIFARSAIP